MRRSRLAGLLLLALLLARLPSPRLYLGTPVRSLRRAQATACASRGTAAPGSPPRYNGPDDAAFAAELGRFLGNNGGLPWEDAKRLIADATAIVESEATLERVQVPKGGHINVVGDVHGQLFDLLGLLEKYGPPSAENPYIFNGDFVDRGSYSLETLLVLLALKVAWPQSVHLNRGNHEAHDMNLVYGFMGEIITKYSEEAYTACQHLFDRLPLAHLVNDDVLVVHGGLPRMPGVRVGDIEAMDRVKASAGKGDETADLLLKDLLWADPSDFDGSGESSRGVGIRTFGPDMTKRFIEENGLSFIIRSHELKEEGYELEHSGRCWTVFSAPNYCDSCGNRGAVVRLEQPENSGRLHGNVTCFDAVERPSFYVPAMVYSLYNPQRSAFLSMDAKIALQQAR